MVSTIYYLNQLGKLKWEALIVYADADAVRDLITH